MSAPDATADWAIRFEGISKSFGEHQVLIDLNLDIPRGKVTAIIGRSGTGKSVTIKHAMGLIKPDEGRIWVGDSEVTALRREALRRLRLRFGIVFQHSALFDSMTVYENVVFPLREHEKLDEATLRSRAEEQLASVGLLYAIDKLPSELSGGMKKRVGLARALIYRPEILLYDEPTTGLDPILTAQVDKLIRETQVAYPGMTSVMITHDMPATFSIADHVVMLHDGRVAFQGTPAQLRACRDPVVEQFVHGRLTGPIELE